MIRHDTLPAPFAEDLLLHRPTSDLADSDPDDRGHPHGFVIVRRREGRLADRETSLLVVPLGLEPEVVRPIVRHRNGETRRHGHRRASRRADGFTASTGLHLESHD